MERSDPINPLSEVYRQANTEFFAKFKRSVEIGAAAPGRVNLIGEHIDYNDGFALPFAIDRHTVVVGSKNKTSSINYFSIDFDQVISVDIDSVVPLKNSWTNYLNGVVSGFQKLGHEIPGFDIAVHSNLPTGAGLSSSAALEVATATFLEGLIGTTLSKEQKSLLCQEAEHGFAGMPCGIMDQFASVFGAANNIVLIDCRSNEVTLISLESFDGLAFLITNTEATHQLVDGEYALRKSQSASALTVMQAKSYRSATMELLLSYKDKMTDLEFRRARHVISEICRTERAAELAGAGEWHELGQRMYESHDSLRDDYEVSCEELDFLVEAFKSLGAKRGVLGSRMTGGGFGGCTITLVKSSEIDRIKSVIEPAFQMKFGRIPPSFVTTPSDGAKLIENEELNR